MAFEMPERGGGTFGRLRLCVSFIRRSSVASGYGLGSIARCTMTGPSQRVPWIVPRLLLKPTLHCVAACLLAGIGPSRMFVGSLGKIKEVK